MKVFLTGRIQCGKSTCIKQLIEECSLAVCGFQTLPFYEQWIRLGFYMHALWENPYNDVRFSIQHPTYNEVIPQVFDQFGVAVLQHARQFLIENQQQKPVLIVDEIGRLEQEEKAYLKLLQDSIAKAQNVLGVLKKCEVQYIQAIAARKDVQVFDLDVMSYDEVYDKVLALLKSR